LFSTARKSEGRIGIFPGTFDPIHLGHVEIARIARDKLDLNAVFFIPNYSPPHKVMVNNASPYDRLIMLHLALLDEDGLYASDFEVMQGGISYTIHTLKYFAEIYPVCDLRLLVGSDSLRDMHNWKDVEHYGEYVNVVGISRAGETVGKDKLTLPEKLLRGLEVIEGINCIQSSTEIKRRINGNSDLDGFLDPLVAGYIEKYNLYRLPGADEIQ
jgi:nicotinate-nucleotide adenylyltransferase